VHSRNFGAFIVESCCQLGLDCPFDRDRSHFSRKLGYEIEDGLSQYQCFDDVTAQNNSDLFLQGLAWNVWFDF
jgi:hypothetical protein